MSCKFAEENSSKICSQHFQDDDFEYSGKGRRHLKPNKTPTVSTLIHKSFPAFNEVEFEQENQKQFKVINRKRKTPLYVPTVPIKIRIPDSTVQACNHNLQRNPSVSVLGSNYQTTPPQSQPHQEKVPVNPNEAIIQKIIDINAGVAVLMDRVDKFQGRNQKDKEYLYLDEMLTQHLMRFDDLNVSGNQILTQMRKSSVDSIHALIKKLEKKVEPVEPPFVLAEKFESQYFPKSSSDDIVILKNEELSLNPCEIPKVVYLNSGKICFLSMKFVFI
jgi:hypothetical protein